MSVWFLTLLTCLYRLAKLCGFCFKSSESISIHPTGDKWIESEPTTTETMYNEDMQEESKVTKTKNNNEQRTFASKYEIPTTSSSTIQKSNSSTSNDMIIVEYPDVLQTKLKDFNFDFTPMDFP